MGTQFAAREALAADQVAGALAAAHPRAGVGCSGFAVRDAFVREGGQGIVVRHVDFDHDAARHADADATRTAIGGYAKTLADAGYHLKGLTWRGGICDGLLVTEGGPR
jgi:hypothetical protein